MKAAALGAAALAVALGLGGCADRNRDTASAGGGAGSGICKPFPKDAVAPADPAAAMDDCLHRWGYALAKAGDEAGVVAHATVAACSTALARWNQQALTAPADGALGNGPSGAGEALSLMTGQPTTPIAAHAAFAESRALVYVVEARAGKCAVPRFEASRDAAPANPAL